MPATRYEEIVRSVYEAVLVPGSIAVDVGAHVGEHTVPMVKKVHPGGRVIAFEPIAACRIELEKRAVTDLGPLAGCLAIEPFALGIRDETADFVIAKDALGFSGLKERVYDTPTAIEHVQVSVRRLDSYANELPRVDYVKIDAEGGEFHVLNGGEALLARHRPVLGFEFGVNAIKEYGIGPGDMAALLRRNRYRVVDVLGRDVTDEATFIASAERQEVWDYVAVPEERPEKLSD